MFFVPQQRGCREFGDLQCNKVQCLRKGRNVGDSLKICAKTVYVYKKFIQTTVLRTKNSAALSSSVSSRVPIIYKKNVRGQELEYPV